MCETKGELNEMRDWLADCFEDVDFDNFTPKELRAAVIAHYDGGLAQFYRDSERTS